MTTFVHTYGSIFWTAAFVAPFVVAVWPAALGGFMWRFMR